MLGQQDVVWFEIAVQIVRSVQIGERLRQVGGNRLQLSSNDGAHAIPKILGAIDAAGDHVTSVTLQKLSLEDVFIHFTGRTLRDEPAKKVSMFVGAGMPQQR